MESVWQSNVEQPSYPRVEHALRTQVLVIGGGMAGVLCARKLQEAGKDVILVEAQRLGGGVTARTTAVATAQHDFLYQDMARQFGFSTAQAYLQANLDAVASFRKMAEKIPCDFEDMPSVQFSDSDGQRLRAESKFVRELGFPARYREGLPLPITVDGAVEYPHMGQFHPLKLLYGAARELTVYENSRVLSLEGTTARLPGGMIQAEQVVVNTHFPFLNRHGMYFVKLYQQRSYVLALENAPDPECSIAELGGYGIYMRRFGDLLLLGGGDHRTGKKGGGFAFLRAYAKKHFPRAREKYVWANQDCMSLDGLPYVGAYSPHTPGVYVSTGFNAWGMTNSMVAANVICDEILGRENPLADALRPNRSIMHRQLFRNLKETAANYFLPTTKRCTHMGCALRWNAQEHSWDCPCHGSRFSSEGIVLDTPAQNDL